MPFSRYSFNLFSKPKNYKVGESTKAPVGKKEALTPHLLQGTENHGDLLCVKESLRHQRQAGLCIPLQFIITVIILNGSNLEQRTEIRAHFKAFYGV